MARPSGRDIREEVVVAAGDLIRREGVGAISFGVLAAEVGVRAPSIHHHFARKDDLLAAVAERYRQDFAAAVETLPAGDAKGRIASYASLFVAPARDDLLCLCGALAVELAAAGASTRRHVEAFFADQVAWLSGELKLVASPAAEGSDFDALAKVLLAAMEGALLMRRVGAEVDLSATAASVLTTLLSEAGQPITK